MDHHKATLILIHPVPLNHALDVVEKIIWKLAATSQARIIKKLKDKAMTNFNQQSIDSAYVLRTLLEYYRTERKQHYLSIQGLFIKAQAIKSLNGGVLFPFFREIVEFYFPNMPDYELAQLYRETWCLGNGKLTVENFLTIVTEKSLLARLQLIPTTHIPPTMGMDNRYVAADDGDQYGK